MMIKHAYLLHIGSATGQGAERICCVAR